MVRFKGCDESIVDLRIIIKECYELFYLNLLFFGNFVYFLFYYILFFIVVVLIDLLVVFRKLGSNEILNGCYEGFNIL